MVSVPFLFRALISINLKERCVEYYDSLSGSVENSRAKLITETVSAAQLWA